MANSYVGIRKRSEGNFEINFRPHKGAKSIFRNIQVASFREAAQERARLMVEAEQVIPPNASSQVATERQSATFDEIWPFIEDNMKADNLTLNNIVGLRGVYYRVFKDFRDKKYPQVVNPMQLTLPFFLDYKNYFVLELKRPKGLREEIKRIKIITSKMRKLRFLSKELMIDLEEFTPPKRVKKAYPEISKSDFLKLLTFIRNDRPDYYGPIYFMARTGRRIEEVTLIDRKDIIWQGFNPVSINIRAEITKQRTAAPLNYLDDDLRAHIRFYYTLTNKHQAPYLFLNNQYKKCLQEAVRRYLQKVSKEVIEVKIGCHYFRHRFCTETCKAKLPLVDIQAISGIKDVGTLIGTYCHSSQDGQASVLEKTRL